MGKPGQSRQAEFREKGNGENLKKFSLTPVPVAKYFCF
jgi:hypothetical protein